MTASVATRNRKEDFKKIILQIGKENGNSIRVMDLASGPCRELRELFKGNPELCGQVLVDCYDFDGHAIDYASKLLAGIEGIQFFQKNALRMAVKKEIQTEIPFRYDLIFSTGLFDYLDERIAVRLLRNLTLLLKADGLIAISNYRDKYSNPSAYLMEWVADWNLIYRTEEEFCELFLEAGFRKDELQLRHERQKVMQYGLARKG